MWHKIDDKRRGVFSHYAVQAVRLLVVPRVRACACTCVCVDVFVCMCVYIAKFLETWIRTNKVTTWNNIIGHLSTIYSTVKLFSLRCALAHISTQTHAQTYTRTHRHTHPRTHARTHTFAHPHACAQTRIHTYIVTIGRGRCC